jgi:hypothetical protein
VSNVLRSCIQCALREFFEAYINSDMVETNQELVANGCTKVCLTEGKMVKGVGQPTTGSRGLAVPLPAVSLSFLKSTCCKWGAHSGVVVKALRYKPADHGFGSRWCHWNFSVT